MRGKYIVWIKPTVTQEGVVPCFQPVRYKSPETAYLAQRTAEVNGDEVVVTREISFNVRERYEDEYPEDKRCENEC